MRNSGNQSRLLSLKHRFEVHKWHIPAFLTPLHSSPLSVYACRTPLNSVIGFTSLALEEERTNPATTEYLTEALGGANALLKLIEKVREAHGSHPSRTLAVSDCGVISSASTNRACAFLPFERLLIFRRSS